MKKTYDEILQDVTALQDNFSKLADQLNAAAHRLRNPGVPPSKSLIERQSRANEEFASIQSNVLNIADSMEVSSPSGADSDTSLEHLKTILSEVEKSTKKKAEETRKSALSLLDSIIRIVHRDTPNFPPFLKCKEQAKELKDSLSKAEATDFPSEAQSLLDGSHPFCALHSLIQKGEALSDDKWASLGEIISEAFGRDLATAGLRNKLILNTIPSSQEPTAPSKSEPEISTSPRTEPDAPADLARTVEEDKREHEEATAPTLPTRETRQSPKNKVPRDATDQSPQRTNLTEEFKAEANETLSERPTNTLSSAAPIPVDQRLDQNEELSQVNRHHTSQFTPSDTAQHIATVILQSPSQNNPEALRFLVWRLVRENRLSLAFHIARCIETLHPDLWPKIPAWLLRSVALGRQILHPNGELTNILSEDFSRFSSELFAGGLHEWNHAVRFLLAAATLRPALLAPNTNASQILHELRPKDGLGSFWEYCDAIAKFGDRRLALEPNALKGAKNETAWQEEVNALSQEVESWHERARRMTTRYELATKVCRKWLERGELIYELLQPIVEREHGQAALLKMEKEIKRLSDESTIAREVKQTAQRIQTKKTYTKGKVFSAICSHLSRAKGFAHQWIDLQKTHPNLNQDKLYEQAAKIGQEIGSRYEIILKELKEFEQQHQGSEVLGSIEPCRIAVKNIQSLFDPSGKIPIEEPPVHHVLHYDLLKVPDLVWNEKWEPRDPTGKLLQSLLRLISKDDYSWQQAFEAQSKKRDHAVTAAIIKYLETVPDTDHGVDIDQLHRDRDSNLGECRSSLERDIERTRIEIHKSLTFGFIPESEFKALESELDETLALLPETDQFIQKHERLQGISSLLEEKRASRMDSVEKRLQDSKIDPQNPAFTEIMQAIRKGEVLAANEYIDMVLNGQELPKGQTQAKNFKEFFPRKLREISDFLETPPPYRPNPIKFVKGIEAYAKGRHGTYQLGPIDMKSVPGKQAEQVAAMLASWFQAKKSKRIDEKSVRTIATSLGFNPVEINIDPSGRLLWVSLKAEIIKDKTLCPVPFFGSNARGHYNILCVWNRPNEEDLLNDIKSSSSGTPVLVFYFGRVTEQMRRNLARVCRERRQNFLVVDDALILFLCGQRASRLPILFECTLPFTFLEPYTTTAGLVPPEMFYGRERELESVTDPYGSCFIYGGRQLGKTALLRHVERSFHCLEKGQVALWIDLKARGIGVNRGIDEIWQILIIEFKKLMILSSNLPEHTGPDRLFELLEHWLNEDEQRRILLLLDEADRFLELDGREEFVRAARIKGIMDQTNRRFKTVFAGLHNVQRTTKQENHPLAHYGEPLCIGPLIDNERRVAQDLVEFPLASLGMEYESPDLVMRILSQTNYYPNLIQLYCAQLLRHVTGPPKSTIFDPKSTPPYIITAQHIDEAYQSQELRVQIRDRFMWTLQLDQRYEVIAYSIAYHHLEDIQSLARGLSVSQIREETLNWWPEGFSNSSSEDAIRALLDEMVGLGVLRILNGGKYTLRSPNVTLLMGTEEEVYRGLESEREPPIEYEPSSFRSTFREGEEFRRSPLTAQQESELRSRQNGVSIIFGCNAAGLSEIRDFLPLAFGREFSIICEDVFDKNGFEGKLATLSKREKDGVTLVLVLPSCAWGESWVDLAVEKLSTLKSKKRFARIVFIADPTMIWRLFVSDQEGPRRLEEFGTKGVTTFSLQRWRDAALRQWLQDCGFGPTDKTGRERITEITGNWPLLLTDFYERSKSDFHRWEEFLSQVESTLEDKQFALKIAQSFGLDQQPMQNVLYTLTQLDEASLDELSEVSDLPRSIIQQSLKWADFLNYVTRPNSELWRPDRIIARIVSATQT